MRYILDITSSMMKQTTLINKESIYLSWSRKYYVLMICCLLTYAFTNIIKQTVSYNSQVTENINDLAELESSGPKLVKPVPKEELRDIKINLSASDNLSSALSSLQVDIKDIKKLRSFTKPRSYQKISLTLTKNPDIQSQRMIKQVLFTIDRTRRCELTREGDTFKRKEWVMPILRELVPYSTIVGSNFSKSLKLLKIPSAQIKELIGNYSYNVNFQRDIKPESKITILIEKLSVSDQITTTFGKIIFSSLEAKGKKYNLYWYETNGKGQYFTEQGKTIRRNLLKNPLKVAKVSSSFGPRSNPFNGFTKMHKGVDFSAPHGTPVYAASDGVVKSVGWLNGYGKYVELKHNNNLTTHYAHLSKFAKINKGSIIKQGEIIAYVGATGRATGPHLHYEVRLNGKQVDPMKIKTTVDLVLSGTELTKFTKFKHNIAAYTDNSQLKLATNITKSK